MNSITLAELRFPAQGKLRARSIVIRYSPRTQSYVTCIVNEHANFMHEHYFLDPADVTKAWKHFDMRCRLELALRIETLERTQTESESVA